MSSELCSDFTQGEAAQMHQISASHVIHAPHCGKREASRGGENRQKRRLTACRHSALGAASPAISSMHRISAAINWLSILTHQAASPTSQINSRHRANIASKHETLLLDGDGP
jgi:hypothetical protein